MLVKVFLIYGLSRKNKVPSNSMFEGGRLSLQFISKSLESDTDFLGWCGGYKDRGYRVSDSIKEGRFALQ